MISMPKSRTLRKTPVLAACAAPFLLGLLGTGSALAECKPSGLCMRIYKQDARSWHVEFFDSNGGATHFNYKRPGGSQKEQARFQGIQFMRLDGENRIDVQWCARPTFGKSRCGPWEAFFLSKAPAPGQAGAPQNSGKVVVLGKRDVESAAARCKQGYVWREARPQDQVCVTPEARTQAASENRRVAERRDPKGAYGPNSCVSGYVWREAFDGDLVCVTPERRDMVRQENRVAASRRVGG